MRTATPGVHRFTNEDVNNDQVEIILGPRSAMIATIKWPRNTEGEATGVGVRQTITMSRAELVGFAYEILAAAREPVDEERGLE